MDIYVGNLSYKTTDDELKALFEAHGAVNSARVVKDRESGQSKGFGFVDMPDQAAAEHAIEAINGVDFMGRRLRVNESQPKPRDGGGHRDSGGRGGGFRDRAPRERNW